MGWIRAFEALNYRNYESLEWWAKDWAFHNDWGTSDSRRFSRHSRKTTSTAKSLSPGITDHRHSRMPAISCGKTSAFTSKICMATPSLHGLLPVDPKTGEFTFVYRGKEYRGRGSKAASGSVWQGLSTRIENDIRNPARTLSSLHEALSLVNSWACGSHDNLPRRSMSPTP